MTDAPTINLDFSQFPTLAAVYRSKAFIKAVIGPAGSGKTSFMFNMFLMKAIEQEPASDGVRYSRAVIVRNTYDMLQRNTLKTAENVLGSISSFIQSKPPRGLVNLPLDDGTRVHLELEFLALDSEDGLNRLLGNEMTFIGIDEVSEIPEVVIERAVTRLGRYPSGRFGRPTDNFLIATTNGPKMNHWLYQWYLGSKAKKFKALSEKIGRPYFELYKQPPALIRPSDPKDYDNVDKWLPNPKAENIDNLQDKYTYYYRMLSQSDEGIKAYVEGDFAPIRNGEVVFPEFSTEQHVIEENTFFVPEGAPLGISFDFGRTPVALVWTSLPNGRLVIIEEFMLKNASIADLMAQEVYPTLQKKYPRNIVEWATGDPSGLSGGQGIGTSPFEVLSSAPYNLPMEPTPLGNRIDERLNSMRVHLTKLIGGGVPMIGVVSNCRYLIDALSLSYIYETKRVGNGLKEEPVKSHWESDLADAACYGTLYKLITGRSRRKVKERPKMKRIA